MEDEEFFLEREDTTLELPNFPRKNISFYVNNFQNLVRYEYLSNKYKIIDKLFPLNLRNQKKIAWFMRYKNSISRKMVRKYGSFSRKLKFVGSRKLA